MRSQGAAGLLIATVAGVASGYYIFQPLIEQSMQKMMAERDLHKTVEAPVEEPRKNA